MRNKFDYSDEYVLSRYKEVGNIWEVAEELGTYGQKVHRIIKRCGVIREDVWTDEQLTILREKYNEFADKGNLAELAAKIGRHKTNVCRKARALGLTNKSRSKAYLSDVTSKNMKEFLSTHDHPRGFKGHKHKDSSLAVISEKSKANFKRLKDEGRVGELVLKSMKTKFKNGNYGKPRMNVSWRGGWREIGAHKKFFRSRWEANFARYLQYQLEQGLIKQWEHEADIFWFEGVKRGCVSYLPDFKVTELDGTVKYFEIKGYMDARSKTKLKRMAKYHSDVELILIDSKEYLQLEKRISCAFPDWEYADK